METECWVPIDDEKKVILDGEGSTLDLNNEITSSSEPNQVTKERQIGCRSIEINAESGNNVSLPVKEEDAQSTTSS